MSTFLGVDLGTQGVRCVAVDAGGTALAGANRPLSGRREGRRHEQDPGMWWERTVAVVRDVVDRLGAGRDRIRGIACCGTSGTFTFTGPDGRPRARAIMYDDGRASGMAWSPELAKAAHWLDDELGYRVQPTWALPKLAYLVRDATVPDDARLAHQPDVVNAGLIGAAVPTDTSSALKAGVDPRAVVWPEPVRAALGGGFVLPDVVLPGTAIGTVCAAAAAETGLPQGVTVVSGTTDGCAAQLSAGALAVGDWNSVLGTTLVCKGVSGRLLPDRTGATYSHRSPDGTWLPGGASTVGLGVLSELFPGRDLNALTASALVGDVPVCYPLRRVGERFPFVADGAEGFVLVGGKRLPVDASTRDAVGESSMFGALLTGAAYTERLCFDVLAEAGHDTSGRLRFSGGATRNTALTCLRARILGREVEIPELTEPAAGMAILAAWSQTGTGQTLADHANRMVTVRAVVGPDDSEALPSQAELDDGYARFVAELRASGWIG